MQYVTILGATGSIGVSTLRVIAEHPERYQVFALSAQRNVALLAEQCTQFQPRYAVMTDSEAAGELRRQLAERQVPTEVLDGAGALSDIASASDVDMVMAAIVGGAGLLPTLAAARAGKKVLLANKEALVMAGELFMQAVQNSGGRILPIDSEHNAIFQCLPVGAEGQFANRPEQGFEKIVLTASGGPFLKAPIDLLRRATPEQACAHPNWQMGRKISVDSATLLNKSLELIEASYLFDVPESLIDIVIHPQSIVHSLVYYCDGSVLAQLGNPDMRTPIAYGLAWPERIAAGVAQLDLVQAGDLQFHAPDTERFPCLQYGREAARVRGGATVVLNAANEVAVEAFLEKRIGFAEIPAIIAHCLETHGPVSLASLDDVLALDDQTRQAAYQQVKRIQA